VLLSKPFHYGLFSVPAPLFNLPKEVQRGLFFGDPAIPKSICRPNNIMKPMPGAVVSNT
jgi:hypothetical protein